jgi:hypothetical protein
MIRVVDWQTFAVAVAAAAAASATAAAATIKAQGWCKSTLLLQQQRLPTGMLSLLLHFSRACEPGSHRAWHPLLVLLADECGVDCGFAIVHLSY